MALHGEYLVKNQETKSKVKIEQKKIIKIEKNLFWDHALLNTVMINLERTWAVR